MPVPVPGAVPEEDQGDAPDGCQTVVIGARDKAAGALAGNAAELAKAGQSGSVALTAAQCCKEDDQQEATAERCSCAVAEVERILNSFDRLLACTDQLIERLGESAARAAMRAELRRVAAEGAKGASNSGSQRCSCLRLCRRCRPRPRSGKPEALRFTAEQVVEAFRRRRPKQKPSRLTQALDGHLALPHAVMELLWRGALLVLAGLLLHLVLAYIIYGSSRTMSVHAASGALVDVLGQNTVAGAASTVALRQLWQLPDLTLDELRRVEEVVFRHQGVVHLARLAGAARQVDGVVLLSAVDGSSLRVAPGGAAVWRQRSLEVRLTEMDTLRSVPGSREMDWLMAAALEEQVIAGSR